MRIGHIAKFCKREGSCLKCGPKIGTEEEEKNGKKVPVVSVAKRINTLH